MLVIVYLAVNGKRNDVKVIYDCSKANTAEISAALEASLRRSERDYRCGLIDENWALIKKTLLKQQNLHVPKIRIPWTVQKQWFYRTVNSESLLGTAITMAGVAEPPRFGFWDVS